jgi:hypothetical protein
MGMRREVRNPKPHHTSRIRYLDEANTLISTTIQTKFHHDTFVTMETMPIDSSGHLCYSFTSSMLCLLNKSIKYQFAITAFELTLRKEKHRWLRVYRTWSSFYSRHDPTESPINPASGSTSPRLSSISIRPSRSTRCTTATSQYEPKDYGTISYHVC